MSDAGVARSLKFKQYQESHFARIADAPLQSEARPP